MAGSPLGPLLGAAAPLLGSLFKNLTSGQGGQQGGQASNPLSSILGLFDNDKADPEVKQAAESWQSTDQPNQPLTREQVSQALPNEALHKAAEENGLTDDQAADEIARSLPDAVDKLTPNGAADVSRPWDDIVNEVTSRFGGGGQKAA